MTDMTLGSKPPPRTRLGFRFAVFALIVVMVVGLLTTRLFYLQVIQGGYYAGLSEENQHATIPLPAVRGLIYDRAGRQLAINIPSYVVKIRPADLPFAERDAVVGRLSTLLQIPATDIVEAIDRYANQSFELVRLASDVPSDVARIIVEESNSLPGVQVSVEERREYEYGALVSHVLGYTGAVTEEELAAFGDAGYLNDDQIGKTGVEATFEDVLRGTYGEQEVEQDALGRVLRTVQVTQQPESGNSLELTIDVEIQREAEEALKWATDIVDLQRGVVIVMNPQTGEVLAMVSLPTYDDNMFARGISNDEYQALIEDPNRPARELWDLRAVPARLHIQARHRLRRARGRPNQSTRSLLETAGYLEIGTYRYYDWNRRGFGPLDIYGGFSHSSDTFFYQLAGSLGIERLGHWAKEFGLRRPNGIDLPAEARGIVPTNEWKQNLFNQPIYPGEVYQAGIGQGYDAATPLQVLNSYNALANGGSLAEAADRAANPGS